MLDVKFFFSKYAEYPSSYLLSIHYISITAQFFKQHRENIFFYSFYDFVEFSMVYLIS